MSETYFSDTRRVRAILLTARGTIILIKRRDGEGPANPPYWVAPGGVMTTADTDESDALRRELANNLGADAIIVRPAMQLFMGSWNFYVCRLVSVDARRRRRTAWRSDDGGLYVPQEFPLEEATIRGINVQPRALLDYLLANLETLRQAAR